ncbi:MAG: hypothetical protein ACD_57C00336G0002 [uncultured bacterium]|nr:MAG: hypothetical protein ACD_57C00336G0002 [uncultured bacterium]
MKLLAGSDYLIALSVTEDSNHKRAIEISNNISGREISAMNIVFQESTTVVSKKFGMDNAKAFYRKLNELISNVLFLDSEAERKAWEVFLKQTKKGTSFVDCANLATAEEFGFDKILSFDEFYPKKYLL